MSGEPRGIRGVQAVIFDMDGTLVDSEPFTAVSVEALLAAEALGEGLLAVARQMHSNALEGGAGLVVHGPPGCGKRSLAAAILAQAGRRLLVLDARRLPRPARAARRARGRAHRRRQRRPRPGPWSDRGFRERTIRTTAATRPTATDAAACPETRH